MKLAVVGAGAAGVAAAWAAARGGAEVTLLCDRAGSTALYSGALDRLPWDGRGSAPSPESELIELAKALGVWTLGGTERRVATLAGVLRPAQGMDGALLDLAGLRGRRVAVPEVDRDDWNGRALAQSLSESPWALERRITFFPAPIGALCESSERSIDVYDFARLHDDPARAGRLVEALRPVAADAWLVGPWLGIELATAARMRALLGRPIGETTSPPGGPAGARFEHARDRLFGDLGVDVRRGRVGALERMNDRWLVRMASSDGHDATLEADAVVLAVGGVAAGGLELEPPRLGHRGGASFRLSLAAPVVLELDGRELDAQSSLHGVDFEALGLGALQRVGVASDGPRALGQTGLFVAGDVVAGRPRTVLEAAHAGIVAARAALA